MSTTFVANTTLFVEHCSQCGLTFAMPESLERELRQNHKIFYCPVGHGMHYPGESDLERECRHRQEIQNRLTNELSYHDQTRAQLRDTERSRNAYKGAVTRIKNRVASGVCPCCKRTFKQLAAHMKTKHPTWNKSEALA